jgi:hypothetical protein
MMNLAPPRSILEVHGSRIRRSDCRWPVQGVFSRPGPTPASQACSLTSQSVSGHLLSNSALDFALPACSAARDSPRLHHRCTSDC